MKKLLEYFQDILIQRQDKLLEMSNLTQKQTGIPYVIFINSGAQRAKHACRIKVCKGLKWQAGEDVNIQVEGGIQVTGSTRWLTQGDFDLIRAWIELNLETILAYWNSELSTADMLAAIQPLNPA